MCLVCRKCHSQESIKKKITGRKNVHHRHDTTSDDSSSESDERNHRRAKYDEHHRTKHSRRQKHSVKAATSEGKSSKKYISQSTDGLRKDYPDQGRKTESKSHSTRTDRTSSADGEKHSESNRQGTESRMKRKHTVGAEVIERESKLGIDVAICAKSDDADSKQKQARTETEQTAVQSKTARQTVGTAFEDARARYLARKGKSSVPVVCQDSD